MIHGSTMSNHSRKKYSASLQNVSLLVIVIPATNRRAQFTHRATMAAEILQAATVTSACPSGVFGASPRATAK